MSATGQQTRLRFLLSTPLMYGASESGVAFDASLPRYIRITDIKPDGTLDPDKAVSLPRDTAKPYLLTDRDILLARSGATVGKAFLYRSNGEEACFAGYLIRARCDQRRILPEYVAYYLQSAGYWDFINSSALQATIQNVSAELYKEISVTHPSVEQQKQVVGYLDEQTAKIDRLMDMRRRQMALLKEQRAALIQQAVTRGLDPDAPMKDSGLPWLGDIPVHWTLLPLKRWISTPITDGPHETPELLAEGIDFVSAEAVQNGRINFDSRRGFIAKSLHQEYCRKCKPQRDDIFMVKSGATTGKLAIVDTDIEFSVWSPLALVRVDGRRILPKFMFEAMHAEYVLSQIQTTWSYGTQPNISMAAIGRLQVVAPPLNEQREILTFIEREASKFDSLHAAYTRQLTLLTEYRAALIHECVTGHLPAAMTAQAGRTLRQADETTSHSTKLSKYDSQVAGYQGEREPEADYA